MLVSVRYIVKNSLRLFGIGLNLWHPSYGTHINYLGAHYYNTSENNHQDKMLKANGDKNRHEP